jgi:predicted transcriptional regulator
VPPTGSDGHDSYQRDLLRFVERFALVLTDAGMPRMPARVFAYVLAEDAERYTAAELASGLNVSPAAISGAVRYLVQSGMLGKEREPGERSDTYRIYDDDVWGTITQRRVELLREWEQRLAEGVQLLGPDRPGGRRLQETQEFFAFSRVETTRMVERWREHKQAVADGEREPARREPARRAGRRP